MSGGKENEYKVVAKEQIGGRRGSVTKESCLCTNMEGVTARSNKGKYGVLLQRRPWFPVSS